MAQFGEIHESAVARRRRRCCHCLWWSIGLLVSATLILFLILVINAFLINTDNFQIKRLDLKRDLNVSDEIITARAERLAGAIAIPTVSYSPDNQNDEAFPKLVSYLETSFPLIHSSEFVRVIDPNKYGNSSESSRDIPSRLYHVLGSSAEDDQISPYLLLAHMDVVPASDQAGWSSDPFASGIVDGYVFGRGAIDCKHTLMGILEALEHLLAQGGRPKRSFYVAFGHDEEVGGQRGAKRLAEIVGQELRSRNESLSFVLDEGTMVLTGAFPGVAADAPVAVVGVAEKGYLTLNLTAAPQQTGGGHSSIPPRQTAIGILARAIARVEDNLHPTMLSQPQQDSFALLAPFASFGYRLVFANLWLFSPMISSSLSKDPTTDAMQRTTSAVTLVNGGTKANVLPSSASAAVNLRLHPDDADVDTIVARVTAAVDDERVAVAVAEYWPPASASNNDDVSPSSYGNESDEFQVLANAVARVYPSAVAVPGLLTGATDSRHFAKLTSNIYRFSPVLLSKSETSLFHGANERINAANYGREVVGFFLALMEAADGQMLLKYISATETNGGAED